MGLRHHVDVVSNGLQHPMLSMEIQISSCVWKYKLVLVYGNTNEFSCMEIQYFILCMAKQHVMYGMLYFHT